MNNIQKSNYDAIENTDNTNGDNSEKQLVNSVIDIFLHRILDIEDCAREFIPVAGKKYNNKAKNLTSTIIQCVESLKSDENETTKAIAKRDFRKALREIERHNNSSPIKTLEKSLFINLFADFDKYVGDLVSMLYHKQLGLYKNINGEIKLSDVLEYESMDKLREAMLDKEIETLRRGSYTEQFKSLASKFGIKTLTEFDEWSKFIEMSQRRNLFTHCDGIVSKQYLESCETAKFRFKEKPVIGDQLEIGDEYFFKSCQLITEVAVMLGQTLWRKTIPKELEEADQHLSNTVFYFLSMEQWGKAIRLSKFALGLPKISTDMRERIFTINYAIALKASKRENELQKILARKDWTATNYEFKLAHAILTENYKDAHDLMKK
jgi:hypothetical protein